MPIVYKDDYGFDVGKGIVLRDKGDIVIFATGPMVEISLKVADCLQEEGIDCQVVDIHTIKPLDQDLVKSYSDCRLIVTAEEHSVIGGLGGAVAETLAGMRTSAPQLMIGVEDYYLHAADYPYLMQRSGLTPDAMVEKIKAKLDD